MTARGWRRRGLLLVALLPTLVAGATLPLAGPAAAERPVDTRPVVVLGSSDLTAMRAAVAAAGGRVTDDMPLVGGVAAELPYGAILPALHVVEDRPLQVAAANPADGTSAAGAADPAGAAVAGSGPVSTARETLGLTDPGSPDGSGVTVAVVDTGVADVPDLAGRVVHVDASRSRSEVRDGYGHGTFVAGLVAGDGASSDGRYVGAAPGARVLDVRVAADDGSTSLVQVLRGLHAVADRQRSLGVRVLNLSLSSGSPLPYQLDPLTLALEALWERGIVVVVPAGNDGPHAGTVSSPGLDPTLLTLGALDEQGTADRSDDTVADYSSRGGSPTGAPGVAKPDLVAPGSHLVSLRAAGSVVDAQNPGSRVGGTYFRGSGTSMSTALASGAVADLLAARPHLSPDAVKALVTRTAYGAAGLADTAAAGAGGLDVRAALTAPVVDQPAAATDPRPGPSSAWDRLARAMLAGDREKAYDAWLRLPASAREWAGRSWVALSPEARSWVVSTWSGRSWVGPDGTAHEWAVRLWAARSWVGRSWVAETWSGRSWVDETWTGRSWVGRSWVDETWSGRSWVGRSWVAGDWSGRSWTGGEWAGRSWTEDEWTGRSWTARSWT